MCKFSAADTSHLQAKLHHASCSRDSELLQSYSHNVWKAHYLTMLQHYIASAVSDLGCMQSIAAHQELQKKHDRDRQQHSTVSEKASGCEQDLATSNAK